MKIIVSLLAVTAALGGHCEAAFGADTSPANALDPRAAIPALTYRSAFADYRRLGDEALIPWKHANDEVGRIGGWRVYAKEASEPAQGSASPNATPKPAAVDKSPAAPPPKTESSAPSGHGQHK